MSPTPAALRVTARRRIGMAAAPAVMGLVIAAAGAPATADAAPLVIADGHVDAPAVRIIGGRLNITIRDGRAGRPVWRNPTGVVLRVTDRARASVPAGMGFIAPQGTTVWIIPQTQRPGVVWSGWSTETIRPAQVRGGITWQLDGVTGPGRMVLFQTGGFGARRVLFSSATRMPQRRVLPAGVHQHGNWVFTKKGVYRLRFTVTATTRAGVRRTANTTITYRVG